MLSKRVAAMGLSVLLAMSVLTMPVFAHGHHSGRHHRQSAGSCAVSTNVTPSGERTWASCPLHADSDAQCPICSVDGCTERGHHYHDDTVYCGYPHEHGYCDGSCEQAGEPAPSGSSSGTWNYRRHHGC